MIYTISSSYFPTLDNYHFLNTHYEFVAKIKDGGIFIIKL